MDVVFRSVIQSLPRELREALAVAELLDSRVLDAYPRSSAEELGLNNASQVPARVKRTGKGTGLQSVGVSCSPLLVPDSAPVRESALLSAGVEQLVDEDDSVPGVCSRVVLVSPTRSGVLDEKLCFQSEEVPSLCKDAKSGALEVADKSFFTDSSCHSEGQIAKVESSKASRQSQPGPSTAGGSSKNPRQSQPVFSSHTEGQVARVESSKAFRQSQPGASKNARKSQPISSRVQPKAERRARGVDRAARGNVALAVESTAAQENASDVEIVLNSVVAERTAARDAAWSETPIVLKSVLPTICHAGAQELSDTLQSSENSVVPNAVISSSSTVPCPSVLVDSASVSDETLLFLALVRDGVLQLAFQDEFEKLARAAQTSATRLRHQRASHGNLEAALELHEHKRKAKEMERVQKSVLDQFAAATKLPQRKYHARYQSSLEEGPTARRDAEEAERLRWVTLLSELLRGTQTPMGQLLSTKPGNIQLLGGGKRASTLRSRVRGVQKFLSWLAIHQEKVFPDSVSQLLEFRLSEPCNRGSLKGSHRALVFLEETAGVPAVERLTNTQLYNVSYKELLSSASPARHAKQAPRVLVSILSALEGLVVDTEAAIYLRIFAWWLLLQNWATLRFSDRRGIEPNNVTVRAGSWRALLTRSKTIGADRSVVSRPLVVDPCCFTCHADWLTVGWGLLQQHAGYERDYLLPSPTTNLLGFRKKVLRYDTAFALQIRAFRSLRSSSGPLLFPTRSHFWTPHSGRAFLPSATTALGYPKTDRDYLGGWSAQGSDRYARVSVLRITNMQRAVVSAWGRSECEDPLGEAETVHQYENFLKDQGVSDADRKKHLKILASKETVQPMHSAEMLAQVETAREEAADEIPQELDSQEEIESETGPILKRRKGNALVRTETLGSNPKETNFEQGFYVCLSGKKRIRTLHRLGACYQIPGVDYLEYAFHGKAMPRVEEFDCICKLCARKGIRNQADDSSQTATSSSSSEGGM